MRVEFLNRPGGGTLADLTRPDGVRLRLTSYDRAHAIPHDLAHLVVERELRLPRGLWGSIAAGALFDSLEVLSGRLRHDAKARSADIRKRHAPDLALAEVLVGAVHGSPQAPGPAVARAWGSVREGRCPYPPAQVERAGRELQRLAAELGREGSVVVDWR